MPRSALHRFVLSLVAISIVLWQSVVASSLIEQVLQIDHAQAQYHLLRFCATDSLQHCARLKSLWLLSGFASRHREEIQGAISKVLYAETLTDTQRVLLGLPEYCGGLACTTTHDIMDAAYLGATGSVARFFSNCDWPEAKSLLHVIPLRSEDQSVVARVNDRFHDEQDWVKRLRAALTRCPRSARRLPASCARCLPPCTQRPLARRCSRRAKAGFR